MSTQKGGDEDKKNKSVFPVVIPMWSHLSLGLYEKTNLFVLP